jgi:Flp pilus assembly protein protease CpaA
MLELSVIIVSLIILCIATYTDIRTLEVPDSLNYAGMVAGIGIHLILSLQTATWWPVLSSLIGFGIGIAIACLMYYTGQWGGGDAKLLMALGALFGFQLDKFGFSASYLVNLVFIGGAWGVTWSLMLAARNFKKFKTMFKKLRQEKKYVRMRIMTMISALIMIIAAFFMPELQLQFIGLAALTYLMCYLTIIIKSVELTCMHKWITVDKLTERDWLVKPIKVGKQTLEPPKLGLEKEHLAKIRKWHKEKKLDKVFVRYGVPFVPAFLISFLVTWKFGNLILTLLTAA